MITPAYAPTATERVLPRLALDFTTAVLDSRVTVTRALNTATRVNSSGNIVGVNADLPRFDFNPSTLQCKGLLIEESRANFVTYSQDFSNAAWVYGQAAYTSGVLGPSGTTDAYKFYETATTNVHSVVQFTAPSRAAGTYTFSIYVQAAGRTQFRLMNTATTNYGVDFDLVALTATSAFGSATGTITAFRDGWYRLTMTFTSTVSIAFTFAMYLLKNGANFYAGDGSSGVNLYGAQAELGAFATSYIPTTTTSLTRNADVVTMTGTNFSDWFNSTQGTFDAQFTFAGLSATTGGVPFAMDNGAANGYMIFRNLGGSGLFVFAGPNNVNLLVPSNNTPYNICGSYNSSSSGVAAANGGATSPLTTSGVSTPTQAWIGRNWFGNQFTGWVRKINYWNLLVTPSEVRAFSK